MREETIPRCWICGYPVRLVDYTSDVRGRPIHENCYAAAMTPRQDQSRDGNVGQDPDRACGEVTMEEHYPLSSTAKVESL
jgi:hypothetical protein